MSNANRILRNSTIYAIGNVSRQLVGFIMLPVYTRYLTPADYGVVGLLVFGLSLLEPLFGARLAYAVPKFFHEDDDRKRRLAVVSTGLIVTTTVSLVTMLLIMMSSGSLSRLLLGSVDLYLLVVVFSTMMVSEAVEQFGLVLIRIQDRPWLFIGISLAKLATQLALNIVLIVFLGLGAMGIVASVAISTGLFSIGLAVYVVRACGLQFDRALAVKLVAFSWPMWIGALSLVYFAASTRYFIRVFSSMSDVGLFELATRFASAILLLIWQPFDQQWQIERFAIHKRDGAVETFQRVFTAVCFVLVVSATALGLAGDLLVQWIAAEDFWDAGRAIPYLGFAAALWCLSSFLNFSHIVSGDTAWIARNNYIVAAVLTLACVVLVPRMGFIGAAIATLAARIVQYVASFLSGRRHYDMRLPRLLVPALMGIGMTAIAAVTLAERQSGQASLVLRALVLLLAATLMMVVVLRQKAGRDLARWSLEHARRRLSERR